MNHKDDRKAIDTLPAAAAGRKYHREAVT